MANPRPLPSEEGTPKKDFRNFLRILGDVRLWVGPSIEHLLSSWTSPENFSSQDFYLENGSSYVQIPDMTVLSVPTSLDSGMPEQGEVMPGFSPCHAMPFVGVFQQSFCTRLVNF